MPHRSASGVWAGRAVAGLAVAGLIVYLVAVGLDRASKIGSAAAVVVAVLGLLAPYLLPPRPQPPAGPGTQPAGEPTAVPPGGFDLRGSQGVQVNLGDSNTQTNTFGPR
ncbi:hypothetical protein GA0074695_2993 [Micromonospora viridifaciens]|uniref:Uncharacterized protein n=1 Tax=Micromonospora viridifaciens TaxID=1881 RepID=A0A1C4X427_MICVI|nr:hypothetical protein [Micromonospora viridifaciens]SCF03228.1 hypothetical protein GA0074695_2993 [Micromonospora viridifaciens]